MGRFRSGFAPRGHQRRWSVLVAAVLTLVALHAPGEARLSPGPEIDKQQGRGLDRGLRSHPLPPSRDMRSLVNTGVWRCQATCDETGHIRQGCLMLEDPRLSGLAQRLDHLSKARSDLKSLSDLGLAGSEYRPSC
ncbi:MAG: hypothetical protein BM562_03435 [Alphaproteobacteria bacterium MedPE-SWcel]|nr:MAG: hypothetical protein BM562_03435 [Alphaproteobacteria bacterium MedPE-SWcel]